jgi:Sigma-70, region 4
MSRVEELPPDQRAALSLLLRQRKSYADVAAMLSISERSVHDRAHSALAVLAPRQARGLSQPEREQVGDYLLSQSSVSQRLATLTYLGGSEAGRAWAHAIAAEIAPLAAGAQLPDVPAPSAAAAASRPDPAAATSRRPAPPATPKLSTPPPAGAPRDIRSQLESTPVSSKDQEAGVFSLSSTTPASSRLGGALLLTALVVAIVVAVILLAGGSGSSSKNSTTASSTSSTAKTTTTGPTVTKHIALTSPNPKNKSVGVIDVLTEDGKRAFYIEAQHLPQTKGFFYAIWLYNSHTSSKPLSKSPAVGKSHRLAGGALLPSDAGSFREILVTRETSTHPTHPGHVVLRGAFSLG